MKKKSVLSFRFFVGDDISGIGLGLFGQDYRDLGPNCKREVFHSSFYWKLG